MRFARLAIDDATFFAVQELLTALKLGPRGPRKQKDLYLWDLVTDLFHCAHCKVRFHQAGNGRPRQHGDARGRILRMKDVLAVRPIYHRVERRVRAHIFVAALALLLERFLERRLEAAGIDLSAPDALEALATIRLVTFQLPGQPIRRGVTRGSVHAHQVLKALAITDLKPPTPPKDQETVM